MKKYLIQLLIPLVISIFTTRCDKDEGPAPSSEIVIPNIVKTESQIRDEAYRADSIYGKIRTLQDYWTVFKNIGETKYGYDFGDQEVKIFTDLTIANSDSN